MKTTRRKFLGAVAAAPIAAKHISEQLVARAAGVPMLGLSGAEGASNQPSVNETISRQPNKRILKWIARHGIPDWRMKDLRQEVDDRLKMEPDIMVLRSVSMSAKIGMQRKRSLAKAIEFESERRELNIIRDEWFETNDLEYWSW